jgi:zinc transport system substrate-binding protein
LPLLWPLAALPAAFAPALTGCGGGSTPRERPVVAVSVLPQAYFVDRLTGGAVDVAVMLPPGAGPHTHEPTMGQMRDISKAVLYVAVGHPAFPFEAVWMDRLVEQNPRMRVVDSSEGLEPVASDPHMWVSPRSAAVLARNLAAALAEVLPEFAERVAANHEALEREIEILDAELGERFAPYRGRTFLVFHPAWGYLARDYGLIQLAIERDGKEPSPDDLARVTRVAGERGIRVIFTQPQFTESGARTVARALDARLVPIDPLALDWDGNLRRVSEVLVESFAP